MEKELQQAQEIYKIITEFFINYSFQIIGAIIILLLGFLVARKISKFVYNLCISKELDVTLSRFIASAVKIIIVVMVAVISLGKVGISVTPFVAAIGALSLGAGLAVQGLLMNYGAGLNIILTRPFVVGDTIKIKGEIGQVKEVRMAYTVLINEDKVEITIPNKHIVGEIINNSHSDTLAEETISISYESNHREAIKLIIDTLKNIEGISHKRDPQVGIEEFADSGVVLGIRFWVPTEKYFEMIYRANDAIFTALKNANVKIPYPQREVRLLQESESA